MEKKKKEKKKHSRIITVLGIILQTVIVLLAALILFLSVTEYKPDDTETLAITGRADKEIAKGEPFTVLSWNIGYGALGDNADFFMDGGESVVTADSDRVQYNMDGITDMMSAIDPDIALIQEADRDSARSHGLNEYELLQSRSSDYSSSFASNFKVAFLPYPVPPIGKVDSGIATFSKYKLASAERIQLPIPFKWPVRMANLKRCLLVSRTPVKGSHNELVLINLHLEAYDSGEGKKMQTKMLADILNEEFKKGNYVIAGGDFNQIFSSENQNAYPLKEGLWHPGVIDITGIEGAWSFLMDETVPSCRSLDKPLKGADTEDFQYYLIDGFIVSGNIKVEESFNEDAGFVYSDHNPVVLKATLK